jgi:transcriptional regulator with XRE-family HTH domain
MPVEQPAERHVSLLLRNGRKRIASEQDSLGPYTRIPLRVGKPVTQEELAEAVGTSREWYGMLESGRSPGVSSRLLSKVADVLMLDSDERAELFRLVRPELRTLLQTRSLEMLDAFADVRHAARRLWTATTEVEALQFAREFQMNGIAPDLMVSYTRAGDGHWDYSLTGDDREAERFCRLEGAIRDQWGDTLIDELLCYDSIEEPGALITRVERDRRFPDNTAKDRPLLNEVGWSELSFANVNVRSRRGLVARLSVLYHGPHDFSGIERAELSTLGELTSLALS